MIPLTTITGSLGPSKMNISFQRGIGCGNLIFALVNCSVVMVDIIGARAVNPST